MNARWVAVVGFLALGCGASRAEEGGHWGAVFTDQGAGAKFGWQDPTNPDGFAGPFLECVEPGKRVSLVVLVEGMQDGQKPKLRLSRGSETVQIDAIVGPDEESAGAMIGPSHPVYALFRGTGVLTVQVGGKPKDTFSLTSAPAAFVKFAKACRLS